MRLEIERGGNLTVGSNPTSSATFYLKKLLETAFKKQICLPFL